MSLFRSLWLLSRPQRRDSVWISYHGLALTRISSPPGALTDSTCLHKLDCLGHLSGSCSPWSVLWPALEGALVVNEKVDVIHCGLEERDGWLECVRLSLGDIDLGWSSHGKPTKVDGVWDHMRSQLCVIQHTSLFLSLALPPLPWDRGLRAVYGRSWR